MIGAGFGLDLISGLAIWCVLRAAFALAGRDPAGLR